MAKTELTSVDEYIAGQPQAVQDKLKLVRSAIRRAAPKAIERISYKMPTYSLGDETVIHFAAWKRHYSLYCATQSLVARFRAELAPYKVDKGTISFPYAEEVPVKLIEQIVKARAKEVAGRGKGYSPV